MLRRAILLALMSGALAAPDALCDGVSLQREPGSIHLEDLGIESPRIALENKLDAYFDLRFERYAGTLRSPQRIQLLAIADNAYRVRGNAQQGQIAAWVRADDLDGIDDEFIARLRQAAERQALVAELIENGEVAVGMTSAEVLESLGRPEKKSLRVDSGGRLDLWEYITYKYIPQTRTLFDRFNQPYQDTIYVKVPDGRMAVEFEDDVVSSIEKSEGTLAGGGARIVVPPVEIMY